MTYVAPVFGPTMLASIADDAPADQRPMKDALVAQLDRALDYESRGREFESSRARHHPSHQSQFGLAASASLDLACCELTYFASLQD